ncbi:MAG: 50S ribosomal protein L10 [Methanomicrobia archaeon]|nr:50S ribosomal protein L10 [Methanomicrobia archaeon]
MKKKVKRAKQWKKEQVADLKSLMDSYPTVGIAKVRGLGSNQVQRIRKDFQGKARLRVSKNSLISLSLTESGMNDMVDFVDDQMALIFTDSDAFDLYNVLEKGKIPAPIKAGAVAPFDIPIESGPTALKPGPIVGELQSLGIPAGIDGGKVVIKQRKVAVKEGETVSPQFADILARLEIYPVKEGLDLLAVYDRDGNTLFTPDVLHVDVEQYVSDVQNCVKAAFSVATHLKYDYPTQFTVADLLYEARDKATNVALKIAYPTPETIKPLLQKAYFQARNLALNAEVYTKETMPALLAKAAAQAQRLASYTGS